MITNKAYKNKILKEIKELKSDQDYYRREIDMFVRMSKELGYIIQTYEDMVFVYRPDWTVPDPIQNHIRRCSGVIYGLQLAIDKL